MDPPEPEREPEPPAPAATAEGNEVEHDTNNNEEEEEEEGEQFDFDSGDEAPEADRGAPGAPEAGPVAAAAPTSSGGEGGTGTDVAAPVEPAKPGAPARVNPYSVIDITPFQEEQPAPPEPEAEEEGVSLPVPSGYSVPVPCGYAVPSSLPALLPAYSSPVIVRPASPDEEEAPEVAVDGQCNSLSSEEPANSEDPAQAEDSALARWAADPANTAWMDNAEEAVYDDVPREESDSEPDELIYDAVENGDEGGNSSLEYGWSSSEFESYGEQSDSEGRNGVPRSFLRSSHRKQLSHDLARVKARYERKMRELVASTVGAGEMQQLKQKQELKVQKLMKAAKEGTRDGLERTKAAVKKGRSFIRTKSFISPDPRPGLEEEQSVFIDVDCRHPEAVLTPMPAGLSQQQVVRRCILGSIVDSEKNYVDALTRILEYERPLAETEPRVLSERKLRVVFHRLREVLQCHRLFQMALASRVAEWDVVEMIGDVFVASFSKSMVLDAYSEYVNNFSAAVAVLKKACATKPAFLEFLKQSQESSPDRVSLYSLMTRPIQRFPQFILLLQDMLRNTPRGHPDRLPLQMALTELETLAEKLSERKREADRRCEMRQIAKAVNERYLNKLLSSGSRHLIRSDDVIETVYNERGEVLKTKERRLLMLTDVLMCVTVSARPGQDGHALLPAGQRHLLKWSVPLGHVTVVEYGHPEGAAEHPPESLAVVANAKPHRVHAGPGQLYQDLQNLLHDLNVVGQIAQLVGDLRGHYQNLNQAVAHDWASGLQRLVLRKEEEIRAADCCRLQLQLPGKQDRSGRPTFFTAVFSTFSPACKESWLSSLQMAKLALEEDNHLGWFCVEDDGNQVPKDRHPLLLAHMPVPVAKQQEPKMECAVYTPEPHPGRAGRPDPPRAARGFLWIGSCAGQMGQVAIVSLHNTTPKVIECFNVESRILCMVHLPAGRGPPPGPAPEPGSTARTAAGASPGVPTVCLGTEEGSISVYKSSPRAKKVRLQQFSAPDKAAVLSLACSPHSLYAGLVDGAVAVYAKAQDGSWDPEPRKVIKLGVLPVRSLLAAEDTLWAASGGQVSVIGVETLAVESQLEAHQEEGMVVSHMAIAGVGIWIAFTAGSTLRLFHTETLKHLQDINIATPVHHLLPGHQRLSVTSLLVGHGLLMVGTSLGLVVALPVPRLQGIPKVTGRGMVSYHAHHGPVKFLVMATAAPSADGDTAGDSPPPGPEPPEGGAVWLGGSPGSGPLGSASAGPAGSPEPGPEDSRLQAPPGGGRRAPRPGVSSALVACGGQGHRRVGRRPRQQPPEEPASSLMVWQIPLLLA
ncbi:rho guanine nucleotide exchange factor 10 isoform X3 [Pipistrellus kuhlii]|uniref:rho guanine nucleotide exchange factor 10 isoform X3 n=1 Tax=Pipistrellus kuhlii TaxID=59472 RepID=UPI001E26F4AB|nr:rho guanine nucleotide exchange factor 10 isoform X3 [Pipistrellus kuhlii]